mmetsp:Transcript_9568/g.43576  ORF Transcript_9568/g.43576 Transcript_9568/m.43576 type:complete len:265 (-) Transcript_9568:131-925(-)
MCRDPNRSSRLDLGLGFAFSTISRSFLFVLSTTSQSYTVLRRCLTPFKSPTSSFSPPCTSLPSLVNAMWVIHGSMPSKMCVAYTTVAPRCSHSSFRKLSRSRRPRMSRSTVISSQRRTLNGLRRPMQICTRRLWPSLTRIMFQSTSMSRMSMRSALRFLSMPSTPKIILPALMSPASATEPALPTLRRHCAPRYPRSPEHVRSVSWKGGRPMTRTSSTGTMVLPASTWSSVVLPAPFAPESKHREPGGRVREKSLMIFSPMGYA